MISAGKLIVSLLIIVSLCPWQRFMFYGLPGVSVEMPQVLYPAPLPQYETVSAAKPEPTQDSAVQKKNAGVGGKNIRVVYVCQTVTV